ncbi:MAG: hypothetical protein LBT69_02415 [Lactobacillales bacterium]|nr:hypothetical protein [Lactobacillales bacterium]
MWQKIGEQFFDKKILFVTQLRTIKNDRKYLETGTLSYFLSTSTIVILWVLLIFLRYVKNPMLMVFLIIFSAFVSELEVIQNLQYKLLPVFRYRIDESQLYIYKLSGCFFDLYQTKIAVLKSISLIPMAAIFLFSIAVEIFFIHHVAILIFSMIFLLLLSLWSFFYGPRLSLFVSPYIFSKTID